MVSRAVSATNPQQVKQASQTSTVRLESSICERCRAGFSSEANSKLEPQLERRCYREPEGVLRLFHAIAGSEGALRTQEGSIARAAHREHAARDGVRRRDGVVQSQRVESVINPEGCIDDRQQQLQLKAVRHAREPV